MGPGRRHASASTVFIGLEEDSQQSAFESGADSPLLTRLKLRSTQRSPGDRR